MVVGIALHKVLGPPLRKFVEGVLVELYSKLVSSHSIHTQTYSRHLEKLGKHVLFYKNINKNEKVKKQSVENFNYQVKCHSDLAKLFLDNFMAKFDSFSDTDTSALLRLIIKVDDSLCQNPQFKSTRPLAKAMKDTRNQWAHCKFTEWDEQAFQDTFHRMNILLNRIVSPQDQQCVVKLMDEVKQKGQ